MYDRALKLTSPVDIDDRLTPPIPKPAPRPPGPVSPDVLMVILLDEVTGRLEDLTELTKALGYLMQRMEAQMEKAPVGAMKPFERTISGSDIVRFEVKSPKWAGRPCTSATIYNDGEDSVWVALNDQRQGFQEIKKGESLDFNYHGHALIERFFFYTTANGEANLRIPLEY